jgi:hypothetical protein
MYVVSASKVQCDMGREKAGFIPEVEGTAETY